MKKLFERNDLLILIAVSLAAILLLIPQLLQKDKHLTAEISVDGTVTETIDLDALGGVYEYSPPCSPALKIRAEHGRVRVIDAQCPDRLCENCGWLDAPGDMAVCLPAKTVVRVAGGKAAGEQPDAITY